MFPLATPGKHEKTLRFSDVFSGGGGGVLKGKIGSIWVNIRNEISEQFLISSIFSVTVFEEVPQF